MDDLAPQWMVELGEMLPFLVLLPLTGVVAWILGIMPGAFTVVLNQIANGILLTGLTAVDIYHRRVARRRTVTLEEISIWIQVIILRDVIWIAMCHKAGHLEIGMCLLAAQAALILEGLPEDATERDVLYGLDFVTRDHQFSSDQMKLVRLRYDQNGQRIAVVEFHRRSQVEDFLDQFFPEVSFPLQHSRGRDSEFFTVGIQDPNYRDDMPDSRESRRGGRDGRDDDGWTCVNVSAFSVCFKCKTERPEDDGYGGGPLLTGETDECPQQMPSQYVVIRNLDRSVTEEVLAKGVMKLFVENPEPPKEAPTTNKLKSTAPTKSTVGMGAKPGSLRRVFLMRDRRTNETWRYGFAEFATVEDAFAAVQKFQASTKFTIASKPVVVAFIHTGVFVPSFDPVTPENQDLSFSPIYNPAVRIKYWDDRTYPSVHVVTTEPIPDVSQPEKSSNGKEDPTKIVSKTFKKFKKDQGAAVGAKPIMMPQMELWAKKSAELHGSKARATNLSITEPESSNLDITAIREADSTEPDGPLAPHWADQYTSYADWEAMTCVVCGWQAPTERSMQERNDLLIEHEGTAHLFYRDSGIRDKAAAALGVLGKKHRAIIRRTPRLKSEPLPKYKSYADFDRLRCLLCQRQFRKVEVIWLHEQQSELHKRMLADPEARSRAEEEFRKLGKKQYSCIPDQLFYREWEAQLKRSQPNYRDRAFERRQAFRQPKKPSNQQSSTSTKISVPEKRKEPASSSADADTPAKKSKGAGMLAKMGWTAGAGLGAEGTGRTEAIATEVYAPGVGLGAEGSKLGDAGEEAQRRTKGDYSDFVEKTRDKARERFDRLG
ncbi:hypothetical protein B0T21DRAFT_383507 [Apiosordaria backusii]|uniref:G-patch domain-containing protein n=1 Tax=Apiosordaria backusii TaxID=314023 RepID=A0AA40BNU4_9PEZI|nr:hypothetical protein B0T21DRAFT_383507 [Apiosordaria backusii]